MANKGSKYPPEAETYISIPIDEAEKLYELYENVEMADAHFHTCQAVNFRQHVQSVYKADNIVQAYNHLKMEIYNNKQE